MKAWTNLTPRPALIQFHHIALSAQPEDCACNWWHRYAHPFYRNFWNLHGRRVVDRLHALLQYPDPLWESSSDKCVKCSQSERWTMDCAEASKTHIVYSWAAHDSADHSSRFQFPTTPSSTERMGHVCCASQWIWPGRMHSLLCQCVHSGDSWRLHETRSNKCAAVRERYMLL